MNLETRVFRSKDSLAETITDDLKNSMRDRTGNFGIALAGGSTPRTIYGHWTTIQDDLPWTDVHFFWGDERCVPPDNEDSNYKMARDSLLSQIKITENQIHRIHGEENPEVEARRYAEELTAHLPTANNFPQFDWILLGVGSDGHTASLFPNSEALKEQNSICVVAQHPQSGQKRISLTLPVINNAKKVTFLVTGQEKAEIVREILKNKDKFPRYPAAQIKPGYGILQWYLDEAAAALL
jgi:6-phosphogluconolactonase